MGRIGHRGFHHGRGFRMMGHRHMWRGGLMMAPYGFYGPTMWPYRYNRWRYVHGYHDYSPYEGDAPQAQLPPNSANFVYVSLSGQGSRVQPAFFNKISPQEYDSIFQRLDEAQANCADPGCCDDACAACCCIFFPIIGWCYFCSSQADQRKANEKTALQAQCAAISRDLIPRGITVQWVQFEGSQEYGVVIEVQPILSNGLQNQLWTGSQPQLDPYTAQAINIDYLALQNNINQDQLPQYEEVYAQSSNALNSAASRVESINTLAHNLAMTQMFGNCSPTLYGANAQQAETHYKAVCAQHNINPDSLLASAISELQSYLNAFSNSYDSEFIDRRLITTATRADFKFLEVCQQKFVASCSLPPPYNGPANAGFFAEAKKPEQPSQASAPPPQYQYQQPPPQYGGYQADSSTGGQQSTQPGYAPNAPLLPQGQGQNYQQ